MKNLFRRIKKIADLTIFREKLVLDDKKKIFVFLGADYGNLGDVAITLQQEKYLKDLFPDRSVIVVPMSKTYKLYKSIKKQIKDDDLITLIGGGNFGDLYYGYQMKREFIIKKFKKNKTISFPQSIAYSCGIMGRKRLKKTKRIIDKRNNITLFARDSETYKKMKASFNVPIYLAPDIVLLSNNHMKQSKRNDEVLLCLRNDKESNMTTKAKEEIARLINSMGLTVKNVDTISDKNGFDCLSGEYYGLLRRIGESKLVITDRLHGMIFCFIAKTPCIVINNNNNKIRATYKDWLSSCPYIEMHNKLDKTIIKRFLDIEPINVDTIEDRIKEIIYNEVQDV